MFLSINTATNICSVSIYDGNDTLRGWSQLRVEPVEPGELNGTGRCAARAAHLPDPQSSPGGQLPYRLALNISYSYYKVGKVFLESQQVYS